MPVMIVACLLTTCLLAGCGDGKDQADQPGGDCLVFVNGERRCGDEAVQWCQAFMDEAADVDTQEACRTLIPLPAGGDVDDDGSLNEDDVAPHGEPLTPGRTSGEPVYEFLGYPTAEECAEKLRVSLGACERTAL